MSDVEPIRADFEPGKRVGGKYVLGCRIAVGGMGEIWRACNETTGATVALKVLLATPDDGIRSRLRSEARLGAMLAHRNIVRIFDLVEEANGTLILVMELLRGASLAQVLKQRGTLPTSEAVGIAVAILSGLMHAHDSGLVHRDVTPANVFLAVDPDGLVTPKLVDFGIAKIPEQGRQTLPGSVLGTPRYMSPEQIRAGEKLDGRSDLFSVAAVVYEAITGGSPFDAPTPAASLAAVLEYPVDPDPRIDPKVWLELSRALAKRPYERHASARAMADALCAAVGETESSLAARLRRDPRSIEELDAAVDDSLPSHPTSVEGQSLEGSRRGRGGAGWVLALVAIAGLAVVFVATSLHRRPDLVEASEPASPVLQDAAAPTLTSAMFVPAPPVLSSAAPPTVRKTVFSPHKSRPRTVPQASQGQTATEPKPLATTPGF